MARDLASSQHLHFASCYEDGEDSNSGIMMKRPLIVTTQSSDACSLEAEEQHTRLKGKETGLVREAFLIGSAISCVLQVMCFAICYTIFKIWGQPYWILVALSQGSPLLIGIWFTFFYSRSKSGSLCCMRRKKLDQNVDALPAGLNSIRPARMVLVVEIYFLFGCLVGSWWARWIISNYLHLDITFLSMPSWWMAVVVHVVVFVILRTYFHWAHHHRGGEEEEDEEEDNSFFVSMYE
jgi:hypothetical protein